jgi:hypothetical protein
MSSFFFVSTEITGVLRIGGLSLIMPSIALVVGGNEPRYSLKGNDPGDHPVDVYSGAEPVSAFGGARLDIV